MQPWSEIYAGQRTVITRPDDKDILINIAGFGAAWFALIYFTASGSEGLGLAFALVVVVLHLWQSPEWTTELQLIVFASVFGVMAEALVMYLGLITYSGAAIVPGLPPAWIVAQWALFATLLNVTLRSLRGWVLLSMGLGFVFLPIAKLLGLKFGVVEMQLPLYRSIALIGLCWSLALVVLFAAARLWDGWQEQ